MMHPSSIVVYLHIANLQPGGFGELLNFNEYSVSKLKFFSIF